MTPLAWEKRGLLFQPDTTRPWSRSHASVPTPLVDGNACRVFFSSRDEHNRSHVGFFDLDLEDPERVLRSSAQPVLAPGPTGTFDSDGIYVESALGDERGVRLYTIGVTIGRTPPLFYAAIGMATSTDGETFTKHTAAPIMDRSEFDPCLVTAPFVLREGTLWRMWYVSCVKWTHEADGLQSHYHVKYAESDDGRHWRREGRVCIDFAGTGETNIARLWVVRDGGRYRGWFSASGKATGYRIGYAESADGLSWTRLDDHAGITLSESGWDSQAQAYPAVIRYRDRWFMFYNGNSFGRDGIGLAIAPA